MLRVSLASAVLQSSSPHISSLEGRIRPLLAWKRLQQQLKEDFGLCHLISCLFNLKLNGISKVDYYQRKYWNPHYSSWQKDTQVRTLFWLIMPQCDRRRKSGIFATVCVQLHDKMHLRMSREMQDCKMVWVELFFTVCRFSSFDSLLQSEFGLFE